MRGILERADDGLIDKVFQPLADRAAEYTELDCFRLARVCTGISAIAWILSQAPDMIATTRLGWMPQMVFQMVIVLLGLGAIFVLYTLFRRVGSSGRDRARANPLRPAMFIQRMIILSGVVVSLVKAGIGVGSPALLTVSLSVAAALYFGACANRPPSRTSRSVVRWKWILNALPRLILMAPRPRTERQRSMRANTPAAR